MYEHYSPTLYFLASDLDYKVVYNCSVAAINCLGNGSFSEEVTGVPYFISLPAPVNVRGLNATEASITVCWDEIIQNFNLAFISITYDVYTSPSLPPTLVNLKTTCTLMSKSQLPSDQAEYYFYVTASSENM